MPVAHGDAGTTMTTGEHVPNSVAFDVYDRVRSYVNVEADTCAFFRRDFLIERGWVAALVSEELSPREANDVAAACKTYDYTSAYALDVDHFDPEFVRKVVLTGEGLSMIEATFVTPSYLIVEDHERFMIVSDSDYYWSIAGSASFLKDVFGKPADLVNRDFMDATKSYRGGTSRIGRALDRIAAETMGTPLATG